MILITSGIGTFRTLKDGQFESRTIADIDQPLFTALKYARHEKVQSSSCLCDPICTRKDPHILSGKAGVNEMSDERGGIAEVPVFKGFMSIYASLCAAGLAGIEPVCNHLKSERDF